MNIKNMVVYKICCIKTCCESGSMRLIVKKDSAGDYFV